jgi:hypothetical protein
VLNNTRTDATLGRTSDNSQPLIIGRDNDYVNQATPAYFNGEIDEIKIWKRALSASEIQELYLSNFNKYADNSWKYTTTKSSLAYATYNYQTFASDTGGVFGNTEKRTVTISESSGSSPSPGSISAPEFSDISMMIATGLCTVLCLNFMIKKKIC